MPNRNFAISTVLVVILVVIIIVGAGVGAYATLRGSTSTSVLVSSESSSSSPSSVTSLTSTTSSTSSPSTLPTLATSSSSSSLFPSSVSSSSSAPARTSSVQTTSTTTTTPASSSTTTSPQTTSSTTTSAQTTTITSSTATSSTATNTQACSTTTSTATSTANEFGFALDLFENFTKMSMSVYQNINGSNPTMENISYSLIGRPFINQSLYFEINFTISVLQSQNITTLEGTAWFLPNGTATEIVTGGTKMGGLFASLEGLEIILPFSIVMVGQEAFGEVGNAALTVLNQTTLNFGTVQIVQTDYNLSSYLEAQNQCMAGISYSELILGLGSVPQTNFQICTYVYESYMLEGSSYVSAFRVTALTTTSSVTSTSSVTTSTATTSASSSRVSQQTTSESSQTTITVSSTSIHNIDNLQYYYANFKHYQHAISNIDSVDSDVYIH